MRIVSWNSRYGFTREKAEAIEVFAANILIIQECVKTDFDREKSNWLSHDFYCDDKDSNLGIAIFSKKYVITRDVKIFDEGNRYVVPYIISGADNPFTLYSVWTKKPFDKDSNYLTPVYKALDNLPSSPKLIIFIGDFNTGSIQGAFNAHWYEDLCYAFSKKDFINCVGNQEWLPTFFKGYKSWLDDHCFASSDFQIISFGIGNYNYWRQFSDHCPIIVDFNF
jgi:endonuclease/exonuclease/phosphatase family metal-dependent hydrolase